MWHIENPEMTHLKQKNYTNIIGDVKAWYPVLTWDNDDEG